MSKQKSGFDPYKSQRKKLAHKRAKAKEIKLLGFVCRHQDCTNRHRSETGFCYDHAADIDKPVIKTRRPGTPFLAEELLDMGTTPKRTMK